MLMLSIFTRMWWAAYGMKAWQPLKENNGGAIINEEKAWGCLYVTEMPRQKMMMIWWPLMTCISTPAKAGTNVMIFDEICMSVEMHDVEEVMWWRT